jgi:hypothetical protein
MVSQAVEAASDSSDAVEVSSLMRGMNALRSEAVEGFHCDATPDITYVEVCGKSLPATVHLEWTDCAAAGRPGGGRRPGGGPGGDARPAPPMSGETTRGGMPVSGGPMAEGPRGEGQVCGGPRFGPSNGTVDVTYTYAAGEDCAGAVTQSQSVSFLISRTAEDGAVSTEQGTTSSSAQLIAGSPPLQKSTQADVTRTHTDASGAVVSSVHLTGSMSVEFSSDTPPVRTVNGSYAEVFNDGTEGTVTLENIVRAPRNVCRWPVSGTLSRATSDGQSHTLVFGPDCGTATLDGTVVQLPDHGRPGMGRR